MGPCSATDDDDDCRTMSRYAAWTPMITTLHSDRRRGGDSGTTCLPYVMYSGVVPGNESRARQRLFCSTGNLCSPSNAAVLTLVINACNKNNNNTQTWMQSVRAPYMCMRQSSWCTGPAWLGLQEKCTETATPQSSQRHHLPWSKHRSRSQRTSWSDAARWEASPPWSRGRPLAWDVTVPDTYADAYVVNTAREAGAAPTRTVRSLLHIVRPRCLH